jgi:hypothetical protein
MPISPSPATRLTAVFIILAGPGLALAQTDEIQVYDASIAEPGQAEMTLHANETPLGRESPAFPGGVVPDHSVNGALEFAYGMRDDWELGLYLPVYTITNEGHPQIDGAKLRTLWVTPDARERSFFYGLNLELSYNLPAWDRSRISLEARPIVGWRAGPWDFILNPILDSDFGGLGRAHFAPAERIAYEASKRWAIAVEAYSDFGALRGFDAWSGQAQTVFAVVDYTASAATSLEFGLGHGFTAASDDWVVKLIWNHAL